jgi:hypothetical protein
MPYLQEKAPENNKGGTLIFATFLRKSRNISLKLHPQLWMI